MLYSIKTSGTAIYFNLKPRYTLFCFVPEYSWLFDNKARVVNSIAKVSRFQGTKT